MFGHTLSLMLESPGLAVRRIDDFEAEIKKWATNLKGSIEKIQQIVTLAQEAHLTLSITEQCPPNLRERIIHAHYAQFSSKMDFAVFYFKCINQNTESTSAKKNPWEIQDLPRMIEAKQKMERMAQACRKLLTEYESAKVPTEESDQSNGKWIMSSKHDSCVVEAKPAFPIGVISESLNFEMRFLPHFTEAKNALVTVENTNGPVVKPKRYFLPLLNSSILSTGPVHVDAHNSDITIIKFKESLRMTLTQENESCLKVIEADEECVTFQNNLDEALKTQFPKVITSIISEYCFLNEFFISLHQLPTGTYPLYPYRIRSMAREEVLDMISRARLAEFFPCFEPLDGGFNEFGPVIYGVDKDKGNVTERLLWARPDCNFLSFDVCRESDVLTSIYCPALYSIVYSTKDGLWINHRPAVSFTREELRKATAPQPIEVSFDDWEMPADDEIE